MDEFPIDDLLEYIQLHSGISCVKKDIHILDFVHHPYGWMGLACIAGSFNRLYLVSHATTFQENGEVEIVGMEKRLGHVYPEEAEHQTSPLDAIFAETDSMFEELRQESEKYIDYSEPELLYFMDSGKEQLGLVRIKPISHEEDPIFIMVRISDVRRKTHVDYYKCIAR